MGMFVVLWIFYFLNKNHNRFLFFKSIYLFYLEANYFIILWFLPYTDMNQPWVYMCRLSPNPLPNPCPSILLGCPIAPAFSDLFHATKLDWCSISHKVIYMFQYYFLKSFHPCLLPESKSLFFMSVSLLLSCIWGHHYHLSKFHNIFLELHL